MLQAAVILFAFYTQNAPTAVGAFYVQKLLFKGEEVGKGQHPYGMHRQRGAVGASERTFFRRA